MFFCETKLHFPIDTPSSISIVSTKLKFRVFPSPLKASWKAHYATNPPRRCECLKESFARKKQGHLLFVFWCTRLFHQSSLIEHANDSLNVKKLERGSVRVSRVEYANEIHEIIKRICWIFVQAEQSA